jgi:hypothetical protein
MCQEFVAAAIEPTSSKYPETNVLHYMDDILISHTTESTLLLILADLEAWGLFIGQEKEQKMPPFQYLGQVIDGHLIHPQKVEVRKDNLKTLNDLQKVLEDINWLRPSLKLTTDTLSPLFQLLKGDPNPSSLQELTENA